MKTVEFDDLPLLRALFYGDSGSGKTALIGTAQRCKATYPLLVLNARGQPVTLRAVKPRPLILEVDKMSDFNAMYDWVMNGQVRPAVMPNAGLYPILFEHLDGLPPMPDTNKPPTKFNSIAIDSITYVQRLALGEVTGDNVGPGEIPPSAEIREWGSLLRMITKLVDYYFRLPIHVLMTALTARTNIEALGYALYAPMLSGQSSLEVPSHAELVGRLMNATAISPHDMKLLTKDANGRTLPFNILYTRGGREFIAKWQGLIMPAPSFIAGPTINKIIGRMIGNAIDVDGSQSQVMV